jgi:hypothetical protein
LAQNNAQKVEQEKKKKKKSSLQTQGIVRIMWPPEATAEGRV